MCASQVENGAPQDTVPNGSGDLEIERYRPRDNAIHEQREVAQSEESQDVPRARSSTFIIISALFVCLTFSTLIAEPLVKHRVTLDHTLYRH